MARTTFLNDSHIEAFADEIDSRLKRRFNRKNRCAYSMPGSTIDGRNAKFDLLLRFPTGPNLRFEGEKPLVIARIKFAEQRVGHGAWLLRELVSLAPKYGYDSIAVEAANPSAGIQNFVRKFGFSPVSGISSDWIASVHELAERLYA